MKRRVALLTAAGALVVLSALGTGTASSRPSTEAKPKPAKMTDLDVLFIGAHPDDEAGALAAFGQWNEYNSIRAGVITITRGEGGGNAAGLEEGPSLGILREAEERRAVAKAGIQNVYNLDKVDFYYTVSSPLTEEIWGHDSTLEKVVRIVRETKPDVIVTMNPSPSPGNHGNHQFAARMAVEAFYAAASPSRFPAQLKEGLKVWRAKRIFRSGASGRSALGPECPSGFSKSESTDDVFGVFQGRPSARNGGKTWAQVMREAQREYISQGWSVFPDQPTDLAKLGCNYFTQISSRVPFDPASTDPAAPLQGARLAAPGGLPLGTELYLTTSQFDLAGGQPFTLTVHARAAKRVLGGGSATLSLPEGWTASGAGTLGPVRGARESTTKFTVTPAAGAKPQRYRIQATLTAGGASGKTDAVVRVAPAVEGKVQRLPQVVQFEQWARQIGVPQLGGLVKPVLSLGSGASRAVRVDLHNWTGSAQSGTVTLNVPAGFSVAPASQSYSGLGPGADASVTFTVTNADPSLKTSNQGGASGDYDAGVTTTTAAGASGSETFGLELVPVTTVAKAPTAPTVDGVESPGEYPGPSIDLSRRWEGDPCSSAADCSATAKLAWSGDDLYLIVQVTDDVLGAALPAEDCKRHWRTDSVEVGIDPRGGSENTATTFKAGIFPVTSGAAEGSPGPCFERDADARQGAGTETAPGMQVASTVASPYTGYTVELKIPLADLPAALDPEHVGLNIFVYDSDTQDKTGQTRIGWSTFGGVQGDPYRWGVARFEGYTPPAGRPTQPGAPVIPKTAAHSVESPQSILQSARDRVPLAGGPAAPTANRLRIVAGPRRVAAGVRLTLRATGPGTAHVFVWAGTKPADDKVVRFTRRGVRTVMLEPGPLVVISFVAANGGTQSLARAVT